MRTVIFRVGAPKDIKSIASLHSSHYKQHVNTKTLNALAKAGMIYVAERGSKVIAYMIFQDFSPDIIEATDLFVDEEYRGQGIGKELLGAAEDKLSTKYHSVILNTSSLYPESKNSTAADFYLKFGYKMLYDTGNTKIMIKRIGNHKND